MTDNIYKTGELTEILGVTRDTLRYYEEKGIVKPKQNEENNYRQYDMFDIYALMVTDFYKKRGLSINDVKQLQAGSEIDEMKYLLEKKEIELEEAIQNMEKTLKKMKETKEFCMNVDKHINQYCFKEFPLYEIIGELSDFTAFDEYCKVLQGINLAVDDILTKIMRIVTFDETGILSTKMYIVEEIEDKQKKRDRTYLEYSKCAYTIVEDGRYNNAEDHIMENVYETGFKWANKMGFKPVGVAFANTRLIVYRDNKERIFIEIFIPIQ